jgi:hypothetical protein
MVDALVPADMILVVTSGLVFWFVAFNDSQVLAADFALGHRASLWILALPARDAPSYEWLILAGGILGAVFALIVSIV